LEDKSPSPFADAATAMVGCWGVAARLALEVVDRASTLWIAMAKAPIGAWPAAGWQAGLWPMHAWMVWARAPLLPPFLPEGLLLRGLPRSHASARGPARPPAPNDPPPWADASFACFRSAGGHAMQQLRATGANGKPAADKTPALPGVDAMLNLWRTALSTSRG